MTADRSEWLHLLACPTCGGALRRQGQDVLACPACPQRFPVTGGIPSLIPQDRRVELEAFSRTYHRTRRREGWRPMGRVELLLLPDGSPKGYPPPYWKVRRQTFETFTRLLRKEVPAPQAGPMADLGAGVGWLAHRLAQAGYQTIAIDASLHYAPCLGGALQRAADALRPGGRLIILDTPITGSPRPGSGIGDRHIGRQELDRALREAGLQPRHVPVQQGLRWHAYRLRAALKGDPSFSFPMVVGTSPARTDADGRS